MANKVVINGERCKGCGLCVSVCPKNSIVISDKSNKNGYFPAEKIKSDCTGCAMCFIICPEAVIEVHRCNNILTIESDTKQRSILSREKA